VKARATLEAYETRCTLCVCVCVCVKITYRAFEVNRVYALLPDSKWRRKCDACRRRLRRAAKLNLAAGAAAETNSTR